MAVPEIFSQTAFTFLQKADPKLASLFASAKPSAVRPSKKYFESLACAIVGQQLSGRAADTIIGRFKALYGPKGFPTPAQVLGTPDSKLRSVGLSGAKASYIKNLAAAFENKVLDFSKLHKQTDEEIINMLVTVKGIGRWTAEMFLIFTLGRPDVFSFGDLGLRNAVKRLYKLRKDPSPAKLKKLSAMWQPHRTCASLYLWASLDNRP